MKMQPTCTYNWTNTFQENIHVTLPWSGNRTPPAPQKSTPCPFPCIISSSLWELMISSLLWWTLPFSSLYFYHLNIYPYKFWFNLAYFELYANGIRLCIPLVTCLFCSMLYLWDYPHWCMELEFIHFYHRLVFQSMHLLSDVLEPACSASQELPVECSGILQAGW